MDKTTRNNFSREAIKLAEQALITYFVDGSTEKVLQFFSNTCSSWIGWGKEEIYPTYNDVFNTFIRRVDDIPQKKTCTRRYCLKVKTSALFLLHAA